MGEERQVIQDPASEVETVADALTLGRVLDEKMA